MSGDWIKLHRKLLENPIMQHEGMLRLWIYLLLKANWKDSIWLIPGTTKQVAVPRGSLIVGRQSLHRALYPKCRNEDPAPLTVWRWLLSLSDLGCVTVQNMYNHCSLVTICQYSTYQQPETEQCTTDEQPMNNRRTTDEQPMNTLEEGKEGEEGILSPEGDSHSNAGNQDNNGHITPQEFVERWNRKAPSKGLPSVRTLTEDRRRKLKTRLANPKWFEIFVSAFQKLPLGGDWQPDFDWFIANASNAAKVAEGKYDWLLKKSGASQTVDAPKSFEEFAKAYGDHPDGNPT